MNEVFNYCQVVGQTDVGRRRAANEDNMGQAITQNGLVAVVCDGMGGHVGGATASRIAVDTILQHLNSVYYDDPRIAIGESIDAANRAILLETDANPSLSGMGSTCVLLLVREGKVYIGHVGDSRIYLVRSKRIAQLTKDHSYVQMLVDHGEITKEQAEHHPRKNEITNALGLPNMDPATVADDAIVPEAGDCFVLCSDGLSGMVRDDVISKVVSKQTEMTAQERADRLVELANDNGGVDNITVELVEFSVSPAAVKTEKKMPLWMKIGIPVLCLLLGLGGFFLARQLKKDKVVVENTPQVVEASGQSVRETTLPVTVPFKKNAPLIELVYGDNSLAFKCEDNIVYTETSAVLDPSSLVVDSPDIQIQYNKSLLSFTDKSPGKKVSFSISNEDKTMLYRYIINIKDAGLLDKILPSSENSRKQDPKTPSKPKEEQNANPANPTEPAEPVAPVENQEAPEVIPVRLTYDAIQKGSGLIVNYAGKLFVKFGSQEQHLALLVDDVADGEMKYNNTAWDKRRTEKRMLNFQFKGEASNEKHLFQIPCVSKPDGKKVILSIELIPAPAPEPEMEAAEPDPVLQTV